MSSSENPSNFMQDFAQFTVSTLSSENGRGHRRLEKRKIGDFIKFRYFSVKLMKQFLEYFREIQFKLFFRQITLTNAQCEKKAKKIEKIFREISSSLAKSQIQCRSKVRTITLFYTVKYPF